MKNDGGWLGSSGLDPLDDEGSQRVRNLCSTGNTSETRSGRLLLLISQQLNARQASSVACSNGQSPAVESSTLFKFPKLMHSALFLLYSMLIFQ